VSLVGSRFSAWPSREVLGMDLQQSPGDVFASHNGALVAVSLLRRLALDHHLDPCHHHRVQLDHHHHLLHHLLLWHLDRHHLLLQHPHCYRLQRLGGRQAVQGLLLSVSVHPASSLVAVVVVIDHHELGQVLWLFGHLLRMLDRMRRSTGALAGSLPGSSHL
jgi:hypothetical protein